MPKTKPIRQKSRPTPHKPPQRRQPSNKQALMRIQHQPTVAENIEKVLVEGNLAPLGAEDRVKYYNAVCKSLGLNPLTKPFAYIALNGKIVLYALRDCTDQLRKIHGISVISSKRFTEDGLAVVEVQVCNKEGRQDTGTGAVAVSNLKGEALANAIMKAETKAKRRATLSICGLGMLDEAELDTMKGSYKMLTPSGRVIDEQDQRDPAEQRYLEREAEELKKLNPAQREVLEKKMAEAKAKQNPQPSETAAQTAAPQKVATLHAAADYDGLTCTLTNGMYHIDGPTSRLREVRDVLKPFWMSHAKPPGIFARPNDFGKLCRRFEEVSVKFRIV